MPTPKEHWSYTVNEWAGDGFRQILDTLRDIKVFYDIGANVGGFTHMIRQRFPDAQAYCFEPLSVNFTELKKNVPYATCIQQGVYYGKKEARMLWRGGNEGATFLEHVDSGEPRIDTYEKAVLVELEELELPKPDLIKLDVEGAELNIIEYSTLIKECPWVIIEWHPNHSPLMFFAEQMPNHQVVTDLQNMQFLLRYGK